MVKLCYIGHDTYFLSVKPRLRYLAFDVLLFAGKVSTCPRVGSRQVHVPSTGFCGTIQSMPWYVVGWLRVGPLLDDRPTLSAGSWHFNVNSVVVQQCGTQNWLLRLEPCLQ